MSQRVTAKPTAKFASVIEMADLRDLSLTVTVEVQDISLGRILLNLSRVYNV